MKPAALAGPILPDERILATGVFRVNATTLPVESGHVLNVAVTPDRVIVARRRIASSKPGAVLGSWDRSGLLCAAAMTPPRPRLTLRHDDGLWLDVTPTASGALDVADHLVAPVRPDRGLAPVVASGTVRVATEESTRLGRRAAAFGLAGLLARVGAYLLPWVVATRSDGPTVAISGQTLLGLPPLALLLLAATAGLWIAYASGRRIVGPGLLTAGFLSLGLFVLQIDEVIGGFPEARRLVAEHGIQATFSVGFGAWVALFGVLLLVYGGVVSFRAWRAMAVARREVNQSVGREYSRT